MTQKHRRVAFGSGGGTGAGRAPPRHSAAATEARLQVIVKKTVVEKEELVSWRPYSPCYVYLLVLKKKCTSSTGI